MGLELTWSLAYLTSQIVTCTLALATAVRSFSTLCAAHDSEFTEFFNVCFLWLFSTGGIYGPGSVNGSAYFDASNGISSKLYDFDLWSQNLSLPYGKVHRIDVDTNTSDLPYGIPESNPWATNDKEYIPSIYAWGFRNPYSLSFDSFFYRDGVDKPVNGFYPFWISSSAETLFDATNLVDEPGNYGMYTLLLLSEEATSIGH
jgi:hypothetical protein